MHKLSPKMKVLCLFLLCALPSIAFSCSCVSGSFSRPRTQAIQEDFCGQYSPDVYTARVVGATCNCIPASGDANLQCQDYTFATGNTRVVNAEVVNRAGLDEGACRLPSSNEVATCSAQATSLAGSGVTVESVTTDLPPVVNRTGSDCFYSCSFNDRSSSEYIQIEGGQFQPCVYMVEVTRVFKGNNSRGETLVVPGPDVLTTCGRQGRLLQLQEEYVVGIGGGCNPINGWSTVGNYSSSEFNLLFELAPRCGALAFFPSLTILLALTIVGTLLV